MASALVAVTLLATPAGAHTTGPASGRYLVRRGDVLSRIAASLGVSTAALAAINGITNQNLVVEGTWLVVPGAGTGQGAGTGSGGTHRVQAGETLIGLAARYGVPALTLAAANGLRNANLLVVGETLRIPAAPASTTGAGGGGAPTGLPSRLLARPERLALRPTFTLWAARYGVPHDLLEGLTYLESGWQNSVVSPDGAVGIGQLMPQTVDDLRLVIGDATLDPRDPSDNIRMTAAYLRILLDQTGTAAKAVGSYYQGAASVTRRGMLPETLIYVANVLTLRQRF
ncbi:MAG: LysM peptidoglycan-binding domain-containing protein [Actinobacteria bacterium]|nr:LysM peptidoglycan-binding domain-containing protein [Actinomycetota bacterium]